MVDTKCFFPLSLLFGYRFIHDKFQMLNEYRIVQNGATEYDFYSSRIFMFLWYPVLYRNVVLVINIHVSVVSFMFLWYPVLYRNVVRVINIM